MSGPSFAKFALVAALSAASIVSSRPAAAEPVGALLAAGFVGGVLGAGLASSHGRDDGRWVEGAPVHWYGVPGYQRSEVLPARVLMPGAGPGRHVVCGWQERYDRHEHYVGSRRICWVEAH